MISNRFLNQILAVKVSAVSSFFIILLAAAGKGIGHHFIMRAHLEVLKQEDIED